MNQEIFHSISLVEAIQYRAIHTSEKKSCTFLNRNLEENMTYAELDERARAIAAQLQSQGAKPGDRILLLFSPGLPLIQAFFACLYAGCIAVPIYPPAQTKLLDKAHRIIQNAKPVLAIMTADHLGKFATLNKEGKPLLGNVPCLVIDAVELQMSSLWKPPLIREHDIAFLQYTSGSTMHPKGVIITHGNLLDNIHKISQAFQLNEESISFSWLPPHHDMGLIGYILTPIYAGVPTYLMSPFSFLQNPLSWLQNISKYKATISGSPNFAYDYCVKRIKEEKKQGLDLSCWQIASNGAEPIRKETLEHFYQAFKNYGFRKETFYPCYGLAEATLLVTGNTPGTPYRTLNLAKEHYQDHQVHFAEEENSRSHSLVSCGKFRQKVKIVDPESLTLCGPDQIGEIWVQSASVAQGYWQQDEETQHAFQGRIHNDPTKQVYLRTGDLGFVHEGELYVTGRIKDLIILYGKNHYPQDIEYSILHAPIHEFLGKCAAFVMQTDHEYELTVMCELKNRSMPPEEQDILFNTIFELVYQNHQLELHNIILIPPKAMPHTTSGKIRRNFCRKYLLDNTLPIIARWRLNTIEG
ncbi:fatty acyl-AMP ligase [Fluoribacter dumoffii]|uniref:Fatty-acid--CoA ligase fadD21 n=1 Tax=Fluoribacter dumoffii TaxID=463 RepID=A0A377GC84_9GAMM|nr:fatty acyl-AMP ligase [Fluoribacter dumoffii]KTC90743.1 acyl-CoA synthetase [Fluoribacter dumoffii NY 23]STO22426.1 Putative fatty-acid--CoA ligase fadD21 [Fluoribacter dumoffii]